MRIRINPKFGTMKWKDLNDYFSKNAVYGITVKIFENYFIYSAIMMFRKNKEDPEQLYIKVSRTSKNVINVWTDKKQFNNINKVLDYTKR